MKTPPPRFTGHDAVDVGTALFGTCIDNARELGSERDQAFMLLLGSEPRFVLKVSNASEKEATLDFEEKAALLCKLADPLLPVAQPLQPTVGGYAARRAQWTHVSNGSTHWVRCYEVLPGKHHPSSGGPLNDATLREWGEMSARLSKALRSMSHPAMSREFPWDVQHAASLYPLLPHIRDERSASLCRQALDVFGSSLGPALRSTRHQVVHGDLNLGNVLLCASSLKFSGIVDFGDMTFTSIVVDIAAVLANLGLTCADRGVLELVRMARIILDGYQSMVPLEEDELRLVVDAWLMRCAVEVIITSWRIDTKLETPERSSADLAGFCSQLEQLLALGSARRASCLFCHAVAVAVAGSKPTDEEEKARARGSEACQALDATEGASYNEQDTSSLVRRRSCVIGPGSEPLSYGGSPVHVDRAKGTWVWDRNTGQRLLDMYNNVPCVGHCHARVSQAIAMQARKANINMRYLHGGAVALAERLTLSMNTESPGSALDTVLFCNSGSEANDLAVRLARCYSGAHGGLCTNWAYHGITAATVALSPETAAVAGHLPADVERWQPPDAYRGLYADSASFLGAVDRLEAKGLKLAYTILDPVLCSERISDLEPAYAQQLLDITHSRGGLWIADEVQSGHGRTGSHLWAFARLGLRPDIVTLGKPMGNGHPVAAVVTRRDIAQAFVAQQGVFFSTFGGNPVSAAAAHAVLDVLEDEKVLARVTRAGQRLREATKQLTANCPRVGDVRGVGLVNSVEFVKDPQTKEPDTEAAQRVRAGLRARGVLVGTTGEHCNCLKIRPPLAFTEDEVVVWIDALRGALEEAGLYYL